MSSIFNRVLQDHIKIINDNNYCQSQGNSIVEAINKHYVDYTSQVHESFRMFYDKINMFKSDSGEYIIRDNTVEKWLYVSKFDQPLFSLFSIKGMDGSKKGGWRMGRQEGIFDPGGGGREPILDILAVAPFFGKTSVPLLKRHNFVTAYFSSNVN